MERVESLTNVSNSNREPLLSYSNLVNEAIKSRTPQDFWVIGNNYSGGYGVGKDFVYVRHAGGSITNEGNGLKFHVSVDPRRMSDAWDIVMDVMAKYGMREAKFANPLLNTYQEPGKEITLYAFKDDDRPTLKSEEKNDGNASWERIIGEITQRMQQAGIQPGAAAVSNSKGGGVEHTIRGTDYVSWRDDFEYMANVKLKCAPEHVPPIIEDDKDLDKYFESVEISNSQEDMEFDRKMFKYYHEHINNFNKLGNQLKTNPELNSNGPGRLSKEEHEQYRSAEYLKIQQAEVKNETTSETKSNINEENETKTESNPRVYKSKRAAGNWEQDLKGVNIPPPIPPRPTNLESQPTDNKPKPMSEINHDRPLPLPPNKMASPIQNLPSTSKGFSDLPPKQKPIPSNNSAETTTENLGYHPALKKTFATQHPKEDKPSLAPPYPPPPIPSRLPSSTPLPSSLVTNQTISGQITRPLPVPPTQTPPSNTTPGSFTPNPLTRS